MRTSIVTYLLLYVLKKCWCQVTEDGETITPKHVGPGTRVFAYFLWRCGASRHTAISFWGFIYHTQRRITVCKTTLDEWSDGNGALYLTTFNSNKETNIHAPGGIRTHNFSKLAAADSRLIPPGQRDRHVNDSMYDLQNGPFVGATWVLTP